MEVIADLVKILMPASLALFAVYLIVKSFLTKEFESRLIELKSKNTATVLPIRLQAYERIVMLLERITPQNLILRVNDNSYNVAFFHQRLVSEVREEFNHNLSQQVYMTEEAWAQVRGAVEDIISIVNSAANQTDKEAPSIELAKNIFEQLMQRSDDPTAKALRFVKEEVRVLF